jgi:AraC-like DNA-binding protein
MKLAAFRLGEGDTARCAGSSPIVRSSSLADFKRFALALDLDPLALMKRAGIHKRFLDDPDLIVAARAVVDLLEIAALTSGIEDFGLRLGEARGLPDYGPVMLMLREQSSVRDALRTLVALLHLHSDAYYTHFEEGSNPIFTLDIMVGGEVEHRQAVDAAVAGLVHILRWLLGENWAPTSVCFKHARPASRTRFDRFFRCPIDFQHGINGVVLRRSDLDKKLHTSSPALRRQVERYIRTIDVATSDVYVHQVKQIVAMALPAGEASAVIVAGHLSTDCRTLNRRLARAHLNYSDVLEIVRRNLSVQHMLGSDRPLSDVAGLVGFESLTSFGRWFRGAFGVAPRVWRRVQKCARER